MKKILKLGIVGGGPGSWIGNIHRIASRIDGKYKICAGSFSRNLKISNTFGASLNLEKNRCYSNYKTMANTEFKRDDGIDIVAIMTPPGSHQIIAEYFIKKNFHVISDKPFAATYTQAKKLYSTIKKNKKIIYGLTHNYSAYPMVRMAKKLVRDKKIGDVEFVNVEYVQDWSKGIVVNKKNSKKIFRWKLDKKIVGTSAVLNEIGTHAYHLANYISGLKGNSLFADMKKYNKNINLDNNAQVLLNYENGAKGLLWTCISARGGNYGLRIRIFGSKGSLEWVQNDPNYLKLNPAKGAVKILEKAFHEADFSKNFARVKPGHPEGYVDAFANIYSEVADHINSKNKKKEYYYPTAYEGLLTAKFIQTCVDSSRQKKWLKF
ncbi:MAG: Gfo/Idh/MocA family oxidoreductase [Pelagibacteraceae bacterium]|nr:Gfo/Idh/MocA family oxidoreductase [Pelagibacteraceae bacterium]